MKRERTLPQYFNDTAFNQVFTRVARKILCYEKGKRAKIECEFIYLYGYHLIILD